jgi:hypothetical protein
LFLERSIEISPIGGVSRFKFMLRMAYIISLAIYLFLLIRGISFYLTPYLLRPHHIDYQTLRSAMLVGHTYGVIGSVLVILMLTYSLRKRLKIFRDWGRLSNWLDVHIFFGIIGPLLILLHTSFKVQGLVAVSFWSMVVVALSGIFGRFIYLQIPRNIQGDELDIKELNELSKSYSLRLQTEFNLSPAIIKSVEDQSLSEIAKEADTAKIFWSIIKDGIMHRIRPFHAQREMAEKLNIPREHLLEFMQMTRRQILLNRRIKVFNQVQQIFHYWHVVHKPFAIIMYVVMSVHIVVSVWTGYKWIL